MRRFILVFVVSIMCSLNAYAINSDGYTTVKQIKAWETIIDVHISEANSSSEQQHQCSGGMKSRFLLDPSKKHQVSLLYIAASSQRKIQLSYTCNPNGYPEINGIRFI